MVSVVGIVGAGTMGSGIAQVCLAAGQQVRLHDLDPAAALAAQARVRDGLDRWVAKGRMSAEARDAAMDRLELVDELGAAATQADLVIEAAAEDAVVKGRIFAALDAVAGPEVVLATNTSSLSVEACALATRRPERVIGLHFFNPAPLMELVEVVGATRTAAPTSELALDFVASLGKTAVYCSDAPGFIVNRVGRAFVIEAVRMLEAGEGSVARIDAALEAAGYPMGPFRLIDLIGLDVDLAIDRILFEAFDEAERFAPPGLQAGLVQARLLGRKSGRGFYAYSDDGSTAPALEAGGEGSALSDVQIVERLELAIINEAYRAVEEGVASPPDVDIAMRLGAGHPHGPFERVDALGLRHVVTRLHELRELGSASAADQYTVAASLWQIATV